MRGPPVCLRDLTPEERSAVAALARSRTAPARRVERARVVWRASRGGTPPAVAAALGLDAETVRRRIRRFNAEGLAALDDRHRSGRPATYSADEVAAVIAAALTGPRSLDLPFASWTLDRLAAYLLERNGPLERASPPLHLGTAPPSPAPSPARHRAAATGRVTCRMNHLEGRAASRRAAAARSRADAALDRAHRSAGRQAQGGRAGGRGPALHLVAQRRCGRSRSLPRTRRGARQPTTAPPSWDSPACPRAACACAGGAASPPAPAPG
jgi:transposase